MQARMQTSEKGGVNLRNFTEGVANLKKIWFETKIRSGMKLPKWPKNPCFWRFVDAGVSCFCPATPLIIAHLAKQLLDLSKRNFHVSYSNIYWNIYTCMSINKDIYCNIITCTINIQVPHILMHFASMLYTDIIWAVSWQNLLCHMRTTKAQISLRIRSDCAVWSALCCSMSG